MIWPFGKRKLTPEVTNLDLVRSGECEYTIPLTFGSGTNLRELLAAATSATALWTAIATTLNNFDRIQIPGGVYSLTVKVKVSFKPDSGPGSHFDGRRLVDIIRNINDNDGGETVRSRINMLMGEDP